MMTRLTTCGLVVGVVFVVSSNSASAQPSMSLSGVAIDPLDWRVPGVEISLRETGSTRARKVRTDAGGRYEFRELRAGDYVVDAVKPGFRTKSEPVVLRDTDGRLDLVLALGDVAEEITVWGAKPTEGPTGETRRLKRGRPPECSEKVVAARQGGMIQPPRKVVQVDPAYPKDAHAFGPRGRVQTQAVIATDGRVKNLRAVTASDLVFVKPVIDAVSLWEFDPLYLNCVPVEVSFQIIVNFSHDAPR